eukprot:gnl/MRDRNA2_/MRDRNA2_19085_c0_seq1.p1 gnl/MRDRNA2_/MRDRNA2_19085_c0~~gnl/MRDRNA2_/MRDRNA2_19085_c0_seq1.p1  ORF type:complete len:190 (-),score=46.67 gnl/MRDRNA2_/MRDRNA2_19085_c0_seq1:100-669(-)
MRHSEPQMVALERKLKALRMPATQASMRAKEIQEAADMYAVKVGVPRALSQLEIQLALAPRQDEVAATGVPGATMLATANLEWRRRCLEDATRKQLQSAKSDAEAATHALRDTKRMLAESACNSVLHRFHDGLLGPVADSILDEKIGLTSNLGGCPRPALRRDDMIQQHDLKHNGLLFKGKTSMTGWKL